MNMTEAYTNLKQIVYNLKPTKSKLIFNKKKFRIKEIILILLLSLLCHNSAKNYRCVTQKRNKTLFQTEYLDHIGEDYITNLTYAYNYTLNPIPPKQI